MDPLLDFVLLDSEHAGVCPVLDMVCTVKSFCCWRAHMGKHDRNPSLQRHSVCTVQEVNLEKNILFNP